MYTVKYIHTLSPDELDRFHQSELWNTITAEYYFSDLSVSYYNQYHGHKYQDARISVWHNGEPIAALYAFFKDGLLSYFHFPAAAFHIEGSEDLVNGAYKHLFSEIQSLVKSGTLKSFLFYNNEYLTGRYFSGITGTQTRHFCVVDLALSEDSIKSNIRKSYKSLVNWGKNNLTIHVIDDTCVTEQNFSSFRNFHLEVAGRSTRSEDTWITQLEMIRKKEAFLVTGMLDGKLVSANLVMTGRQEAFYAVGVNDRNLMAENKPVSHYPLLFSILEAKRRGFKIFNMNEIDPTGIDAKADNIARFKRGFSATLQVENIYTINFENE